MKILILLLLSLTTLFAESKLEVVRFDQATEAWLAGDRDKTLELLLKKESAGDLTSATLYNIGYLYLLKGDFSKALLYLQTVIVKEPDFADSYLQVARIHRQIGNLQAARDHLKKGLNKESENVDILLEMAEVCAALKDTDAAIDAYQDILDINNDHAGAIAGLAGIYRQQYNYKSANALFNEHNKVYPEAILLYERSKLAAAQGKNEERKKYLMQIISDYPHSKKWQVLRDTLRTDYGWTPLSSDTLPPSYTYRIDPNEKLDYKVTYGPMTLGWLKIRIKKKEKIGSREVYPIQFFVDTNPSYGFILSLHHIYESYIDPVTLNAYKSRLFTPGSELSLVKTYFYEYEKNLFAGYIVDPDGYFKFITKDLPRKVQDSTSMLYFARGLVSDKKSGVTTVVIDEEYKYGSVDFLNETEKLDLNDQEVQTYKIFARAEFKGVAGMSGDAWGWFSMDEQSVPLKGAIEIIVGSITLETDGEKTEIPDFHEEYRHQ
jgi:tetratricopeptide (TPR) repeat protein